MKKGGMMTQISLLGRSFKLTFKLHFHPKMCRVYFSETATLPQVFKHNRHRFTTLGLEWSLMLGEM